MNKPVDYEAIVYVLRSAFEPLTEGRVWTYTPPTFHSRGKRYSRRNLRRRERFWTRQIATITVERVG